MCGGWFGHATGIDKTIGLQNAPVFKEVGDVLGSPFVQAALPAVAGFALGGPVGGALFGQMAGASLLGGALVGAGTGGILNYKNRGQGALLGGLGGAIGGYSGGAEGGFSGMFGGSAPAAAPGSVASMAGEAGTAIPGIGSTPAAGFGSESLLSGTGVSGLGGSTAPIAGTASSSLPGAGLGAGSGFLAEQAAAPVLTSAENAALMNLQAPAPLVEANALNYASAAGAPEMTVGAGGQIPVGQGGIYDTLMQAQAAGVPGIQGGAQAAGGGGMFESLMASLGMGGGGAAMGGGGGVGGLGTMLGLSSLANAGIGMYQANQLRQASQAADPWARYRAQYGDQLNALMQNPSQIQNIPGYQAGMQAIERSLASQGYQGSGNMMNAMANYGGQFYQQQLANLANLAGVNNVSTGLQGQFNAANMLGGSLQGIPNALLYASLLGRRGY